MIGLLNSLIYKRKSTRNLLHLCRQLSSNKKIDRLLWFKSIYRNWKGKFSFDFEVFLQEINAYNFFPSSQLYGIPYWSIFKHTENVSVLIYWCWSIGVDVNFATYLYSRMGISRKSFILDTNFNSKVLFFFNSQLARVDFCFCLSFQYVCTVFKGWSFMFQHEHKIAQKIFTKDSFERSAILSMREYNSNNRSSIKNDNKLIF